MAKQRYINTKIWEDAWFSELDQIEQLVFIYLLTNPATNISGVYELSLRTICTHTKLEKMLIQEMFERFAKANKVMYVDGWVILKNFLRHQNLKNSKIRSGVEAELGNVPDSILENIGELIEMHGLKPKGDRSYMTHDDSSHLIKLNIIKSNLIKSNTKSPYGEFGRVKLTDEEKNKLDERLGEKNTELLITELDSYIASKGKRYSSHYATILTWARKKLMEHQEKATSKGKKIII